MAKFSLDHLVSWMLLLFFYQFHKKPNIISQTTTEHYTCIDKFHIIKWSMFIIKSIMSMLLMFFFFLYLANLIISLFSLNPVVGLVCFFFFFLIQFIHNEFFLFSLLFPVLRTWEIVDWTTSFLSIGGGGVVLISDVM